MNLRQLVFMATAMATTTAASILPADASNWGLYNWGYSPYSGSANWQWIARSFGYPLRSMSSQYAPFYLLNPLIYNASYMASNRSQSRKQQQQFEQYQAQQMAQYQQQSTQFQQGQQYTDPEPFNYPRQRNRQFMQSAYPVDQISTAPWLTGGPAPSASGQGPEWAGPDPVNDDPFKIGAPQVVPGQAPLVAAAPGVSPTAPGAIEPPVAPDRARVGNLGTDAAPAEIGVGSPFAGAFIELVKTKFKGNIARALKDKQARQLARTLGVLPEGNFDADDVPLERLALIEKVLNDDRESPTTRLSTVRMLLKY
jgi:hypothetical protein